MQVKKQVYKLSWYQFVASAILSSAFLITINNNLMDSAVLGFQTTPILFDILPWIYGTIGSHIYRWRIYNIYLLNPPMINDISSLGGGFFSDSYIQIYKLPDRFELSICLVMSSLTYRIQQNIRIDFISAVISTQGRSLVFKRSLQSYHLREASGYLRLTLSM